jgi:hypothetical protein
LIVYGKEQAMKLNSNPFMIVLGIIMILVGIASFMGYVFVPDNNYLIWGTLGVAVLMAMLVFSGTVKESVGVLMIVIWLALVFAMAYFNFDFTYSELIRSMLPLGAGFFLLIGL